MRKSLHLVLCTLVFTAAASVLTAQDQATVTVASGDSPAAGIDVFLFANQGKHRAGTTSSNGTLAFDVSLLAGKIRGDAYVQECPGGIQLILVGEGETYNCEQDVGEENCTCKKAGAWFSSDGQIAIDLNAGGASSIASNPVFLGTVVPAAGIVTYLGVRGDGDNDASGTGTTTTLTDLSTTTSTGTTGTGGPPPATDTGSAPETNATPSMISGSYPAVFRQQMDECSFFVNSFNGVAIVDASDSGTLKVEIVETVRRTYMGTFMMTGSMIGNGQATGSGSILGNPFTGDVTLTYDGNGLDILETIRLTNMGGCAGVFFADNAQRQDSAVGAR